MLSEIYGLKTVLQKYDVHGRKVRLGAIYVLVHFFKFLAERRYNILIGFAIMCIFRIVYYI